MSKVFNPEFSFDFGQAAETSNSKPVKQKATTTTKKSAKTETDTTEQNLPEFVSKEDHVRVKTQSIKKKSQQEKEFFELPSKAEKKKNEKISSFGEMNISKPLIKALNQMGISQPTPIQSASVPTALLGKDICACAVTGSGKTLSFMLPTLERLLYKPKIPQRTRVLVLTPTRELAAQICKVTRDLAQFTSINVCLCAGGFDLRTQEAALRLSPDIVIATPGRLIDHLHNTPCFNLDTVEVLVLDEADRMLDEHFAEQLKEVMRLCSPTHQTMLFSATMTDRVEDLVRLSLKRPVKIFINENVDVTPLLKQEFVRLRDASEANREAILAALIERKFNDRTIVFVRTKSDCHRICILLNLLELKAAELHGGLTQTQRLDKLNSFKEKEINVLVATDLAARGLDIADVKTVINFSMPMTFKHYIHRVGRTARAEASGRSISLVGEKDRWLVKEIVKSSQEPVKCRVIPQDVIEFYREKVSELRPKLKEKLEEEASERMMKEAETDLTRAERAVNSGGKDAEKKRRSSSTPLPIKRKWLDNVDYKTGELKSELAKKKALENKTKRKSKAKKEKTSDSFDDESDFDDDENDYDDDDETDARKFKKSGPGKNKKFKK